MSPGATPAFCMAAAPDAIASPEVVLPTRRSRMPLRSTIHASVVSSVASRSALVTTFSGSAVPHPVMRADLTSTSWSCGSEPCNGLARHHALAEVGEDSFDTSRERRPHLRIADGAEQVTGLDRTAGAEIGHRFEEPRGRTHDDALGHEEMLAFV